MNVTALFREYARLDLMRAGDGISIPQFERWSRLKDVLEHRFRGPHAQRRPERRSSPRIPTRLHCTYASCDELRKASIRDLATGGVFIQTVSPAPIGTPLELRIHIEESGAEIEVQGSVVSTNYCPEQPGARGMGVRFEMVTREAIEAISDLFAREAAREARRQATPETERSEAPEGTPETKAAGGAPA